MKSAPACCALAFAVLTACSTASKPTPEQAKAFIDEVEQKLLTLGIEAGRAEWIKSTYITGDTEALAAKADVILLDNMTPAQTREAVLLVRSTPGGEHLLLESSGGITLHTVRHYAEAGVDLISVGALTHSAPAVDISLELTTEADC